MSASNCSDDDDDDDKWFRCADLTASITIEAIVHEASRVSMITDHHVKRLPDVEKAKKDYLYC